MLSLGKIAAGPGAARYYTDQVARGQEDYYAGQREEPGQWVGAGAAGLGWEGEVDADVFAHLLGGVGLRRPPETGGVAGIDLTFRAPKSVSVLWGVGPDELGDELRAGHDAAVREALGYLEREACWARRGAGGKVHVPGGGFVGAAFMHRASRAGDPLLHTHVVGGNLTQGPDGRWTALDARHLYRQAKTAGYLYQAVLRAEITERTGLDWNPVEHGVADLAAIPREVVEHFSQRRREILEHMAEHGGRSATSAQVAALETRRAKDEPPLARQRAEWRARASEHGLTPDQVADLVGAMAPRDVPLTEAIDPEVLTKHASTFGRPELLQALAEAQPDGAHVIDLERLAVTALDEHEVVRLRDGTAAASVIERRYSTRDLLATEARLLESAAKRRAADVAVVPREKTAAALAERATLSTEQRAVVVGLARAGDGVAVLRAAAGTGKTFTLDAAREAWQSAGIEVRGCALSARAARELEDQSAIPSHTIAALRHSLNRGDELAHGSVLVVDEAGMVGTRALADLADAATRSGAKLVLVGDDRQLPEIEAGGAFRALAAAPATLELREVRRQREPWDRAALDALRDGNVERWARAYRRAGHITVASTAADTRAALVNDWARSDVEDRLMIAARRSDVRDLNDRARQLRRETGDLGPDELTVAGRGFATGDQVLATRNCRHLGLLNGQRGTVTAVNPQEQSVTIDIDGEERTADAEYLTAGHLDHGYAITAHRAQGATVDRTFVLGSEELYREWGYTALSRHRDAARFYVARTDLELDADLAPAVDPVVAGLERLLGRSRAKDLASDSLPDLADADLEAEDRALRDRLERDPPPHPAHLTALTDKDAAARTQLDETTACCERYEAELDETPRWRRTERAELRRILESNRRVLPSQQERWDDLHARHLEAQAATTAWLARNGPDATRLLQLAEEQQLRAAADRHAHRQLERLGVVEPPSAPQTRPMPTPAPSLSDDVGLDLDW